MKYIFLNVIHQIGRESESLNTIHKKQHDTKMARGCARLRCNGGQDFISALFGMFMVKIVILNKVYQFFKSIVCSQNEQGIWRKLHNEELHNLNS
jgi:hypothetical protein